MSIENLVNLTSESKSATLKTYHTLKMKEKRFLSNLAVLKLWRFQALYQPKSELCAHQLCSEWWNLQHIKNLANLTETPFAFLLFFLLKKNWNYEILKLIKRSFLNHSKKNYIFELPFLLLKINLDDLHYVRSEFISFKV